MKNTNNDTAIPNPALKSFSVFVGEWKTTGIHPKLPGITLHGYTSIHWFEGGAFLVMRSKTNEGTIPSSISIFGSDNTKGAYFMLCFDDRQVSRKCDVIFQDKVLKWWRNAPEFSHDTLLHCLTMEIQSSAKVRYQKMAQSGSKIWTSLTLV